LSKPDYQSAWIGITTNAVYAVTHGLGKTPSRVIFQFSTDGGNTIVYEGWGHYDAYWGWVYHKNDSPYDYYNATTVSVMTGSILRSGGDSKPAANSMRILAWR